MKKKLFKSEIFCYNREVGWRDSRRQSKNGVWRSLVARSAGGREVAGSNPVTPTEKPLNSSGFKGFSFFTFSLHKAFSNTISPFILTSVYTEINQSQTLHTDSLSPLYLLPPFQYLRCGLSRSAMTQAFPAYPRLPPCLPFGLLVGLPHGLPP